MHSVLDALTRLLAPIIAFTAEEAWGYSQPGTSVHLQDFPKPDARWTNPDTVGTMDQLLQIRSRISQAVEKPQKAGDIGSALEARVKLSVTAAEATLLEPLKVELEEVFILSDLEVVSTEAAGVEISKLRTPAASAAGVTVQRSARAPRTQPSAPAVKKRWLFYDEASVVCHPAPLPA